MTLIDTWILLLSFAILMYVVLDGFDLGVGILMPFVTDEDARAKMFASIAPVWDGNETWLIFTGVGLLAIFPKVYAVLFSAIYIPVIAMLIGLIFRGVAFEFREIKPQKRLFWDRAFYLGSYLVAFTQGVILGSLLQGIPVSNGHYSGDGLEWLSPFALFTGLAVVLGYALMGGTWLIMKVGETLQSHFRRLSLIALGGTSAGLAIISAWTPALNDYYFAKWFSSTGLLWAGAVAITSMAFIFAIVKTCQSKHAYKPFLASIGLFSSGFAGVLFTLYPYALPPSVSFQSSAAPESSLVFLLQGTLVILPIILLYFAYIHWRFRGKVSLNKDYAN